MLKHEFVGFIILIKIRTRVAYAYLNWNENLSITPCKFKCYEQFLKINP